MSGPPVELSERLKPASPRGLVKIVRLFILSGAEQVVSSGTNFLFLSALSRALGLHAFGIYNLAWSGVMLAEGMIASLFGDTGVALSFRTPSRLRPSFRGAHYALSMALAILAAVVCCVAALLRPAISGVLILSGFACVGYRMQQAFRRFCYWDSRRGLALTGALLACTVLILPVILGRTPRHVNAALAVTTASYVTAGLMLLKLRSQFRRPDGLMLRWCWTQAIGSGRWLLIATFCYWFSNMGVIWIAASVRGPASGAALRILLLLSNPLSQIGALSATVLLPITARRLASGRGEGVLKVAAPTILLFCLIAAVYVATLSAFGLRVIAVFFPGKAPSVSSLSLLLIGLAAAFDMIETAVTLPQIALNRTAGFLVARVCSAGTLAAFALVLMPTWGLDGLLASMAAASVVQMAAACIALMRYARQYRASSPSSPEPVSLA